MKTEVASMEFINTEIARENERIPWPNVSRAKRALGCLQSFVFEFRFWNLNQLAQRSHIESKTDLNSEINVFVFNFFF